MHTKTIILTETGNLAVEFWFFFFAFIFAFKGKIAIIMEFMLSE